MEWNFPRMTNRSVRNFFQLHLTGGVGEVGCIHRPLKFFKIFFHLTAREVISILMKLIRLLLFVIPITQCLSQTTVKGKVIERYKPHEPLPGVIIKERGTNNGTTSDINGNFQIDVADTDTSTLIFSFVGFDTKEIKIKGRDYMEVRLGGCIKDFFDSRRVIVFASSGFINTPTGGQLAVASPWTKIGVIRPNFQYQTDAEDKEYINAGLEFRHVFVSCQYDLDLEFGVRDLTQTDSNARLYSFESINNFDEFLIVAGYGTRSLTINSDDITRSSHGPVLGVGRYIGKPFHGKMIARVTILDEDLEYRGIFQIQHRRFFGYLQYYKLGSFNELSLGLGYSFGY